jgi:protein-L-isoaspartate(D-aspartate) O-methyltransferase
LVPLVNAWSAGESPEDRLWPVAGRARALSSHIDLLRENQVQRRDLLRLFGATAAGLATTRAGFAVDTAAPTVAAPATLLPTAFDFALDFPTANREAYVAWMAKNRSEEPKFLRQRFDRYATLLHNKDIWDKAVGKAFLMTPREEFCLKANWPRAYDHAFLDIGYGVTISGPFLVARMTSTLNIAKGDKVLEVGTGSGYQSAFLAHLTDSVHTIEIIKPLAERTRATYDELIARGYSEFKNVSSKNADGYYGWEEAAPFDKIVVTCGIDHIPPPLLQQLKPGGIMVIPVGPPGAQHVIKVVKEEAADKTITVKRSDIYAGKIVPFVPFTKLDGESIVGTHNQ